MGLYRNIAGFLGNTGQVGLSFYDTPSITFGSGGLSLPSPFNDPVGYQQQLDTAATNYEVAMNAQYDWLMSHTYPEITAAGYYVTPDNGSIFQWTDKAAGNSVAYLPLDWIQKIENGRGTPGALLLHMQEPALAKDTAGYEGGSSASWLGVEPGTNTVTDPIPAVQTLSPVQPTPTTTTTTPVSPTATTTTTQTLPSAAAITNNFLPLALIAGLGVVAVAGDQLLHERRKVVFAGGVAALFYLMAKRT